MGKETKVGLVVIGSLLALLSGVMGYRVWQNRAAATLVASLPPQARSPEPRQVTTAKPTLLAESGGPAPPQAEPSAWAPAGSRAGAAPQADPSARYLPNPVSAAAGGRYSQTVEVEPDDPPPHAAAALPVEPLAEDRLSGEQHIPAQSDLPDPTPGPFSPAADIRLAAGGEPAPRTYADPAPLPPPTSSGRYAAPETSPAAPAPRPSEAYYADPVRASGAASGLAPLPPSDRTARGALAPAASSARPERGEYVVQPNDSFWTISLRVYGTGSFYRALYAYNEKDHPWPDKLKVGKAVRVPPPETLMQAYPDLCPRPSRHQQELRRAQMVQAGVRSVHGGRVYVVQKGDTLFDIAKQELGEVARWGEIYQLNRELLGEEFDYLSPGMQLVLPDAGNEPGAVTRRPGPDTRR